MSTAVEEDVLLDNLRAEILRSMQNPQYKAECKAKSKDIFDTDIEDVEALRAAALRTLRGSSKSVESSNKATCITFRTRLRYENHLRTETSPTHPFRVQPMPVIAPAVHKFVLTNGTSMDAAEQDQRGASAAAQAAQLFVHHISKDELLRPASAAAAQKRSSVPPIFKPTMNGRTHNNNNNAQLLSSKPRSNLIVIQPASDRKAEPATEAERPRLLLPQDRYNSPKVISGESGKPPKKDRRDKWSRFEKESDSEEEDEEEESENEDQNNLLEHLEGDSFADNVSEKNVENISFDEDGFAAQQSEEGDLIGQSTSNTLLPEQSRFESGTNLSKKPFLSPRSPDVLPDDTVSYNTRDTETPVRPVSVVEEMHERTSEVLEADESHATKPCSQKSDWTENERLSLDDTVNTASSLLVPDSGVSSYSGDKNDDHSDAASGNAADKHSSSKHLHSSPAQCSKRSSKFSAEAKKATHERHGSKTLSERPISKKPLSDHSKTSSSKSVATAAFRSSPTLLKPVETDSKTVKTDSGDGTGSTTKSGVTATAEPELTDSSDNEQLNSLKLLPSDDSSEESSDSDARESLNFKRSKRQKQEEKSGQSERRRQSSRDRDFRRRSSSRNRTGQSRGHGHGRQVLSRSSKSRSRERACRGSPSGAQRAHQGHHGRTRTRSRSPVHKRRTRSPPRPKPLMRPPSPSRKRSRSIQRDYSRENTAQRKKTMPPSLLLKSSSPSRHRSMEKRSCRHTRERNRSPPSGASDHRPKGSGSKGSASSKSKAIPSLLDLSLLVDTASTSRPLTPLLPQQKRSLKSEAITAGASSAIALNNKAAKEDNESPSKKTSALPLEALMSTKMEHKQRHLATTAVKSLMTSVTSVVADSEALQSAVKKSPVSPSKRPQPWMSFATVEPPRLMSTDRPKPLLASTTTTEKEKDLRVFLSQRKKRSLHSTSAADVASKQVEKPVSNLNMLPSDTSSTFTGLGTRLKPAPPLTGGLQKIKISLRKEVNEGAGLAREVPLPPLPLAVEAIPMPSDAPATTTTLSRTAGICQKTHTGQQPESTMASSVSTKAPLKVKLKRPSAH